jgi:putative ABC transport system permease protein
MPDWRSEIAKILTPLHLDPAREASLVAELEQHVEEHYADLLKQGISEEIARKTVLAGIGSYEVLTQLRRLSKRQSSPVPETGTGNFWDELRLDLRFAARMLRKSPGFAAVAFLTLALGFGANTAVFSLVEKVLLRPLYPDIQRLVVLQDIPLAARKQKMNMNYAMSYPIYQAWKENKDIFESVGALASQGPSLTGMGDPERLMAAFVSSDFLPMLGVQPILGRAFTPKDEPYSAPAVVLLSKSFWRSHFNSDRAVLGRKLTLNDKPATVIGVVPDISNFRASVAMPFDLVLPLREEPKFAVVGFNHLFVVGKIRSDLTQASALAAIETRAKAVNAKFGRSDQAIQVIPLETFLTVNAKPVVLILFGAVAVVLLIACANTANLLLARGAAREKEVAIRFALGARRGRLLRQLLTESLLISLLGAGLGLAGMWATERLLTRLLANHLPPEVSVHVNAAVLVFNFGLATVVGIIFGILPGVLGAGKHLREKLNQGGRLSQAPGSHRLRNALVVAEIAFSLVLLVGTGLLLRSFIRLMNVDKGFEADHVLTLRIWPSPTRYSDPRKYITYMDTILERTRALPGVKAAGWTSCLPVSGTCISGDFDIEGAADPQKMIMGSKQLTSGDYFQAMHVQLVAGRLFDAHDKIDSAPVAIIDQVFAKQYFGSENPVGQHIDFGWGGKAWAEIVGVVGEVKEAPDAPGNPTVYVPLAQRPAIIGQLAFSLAARTSYDPADAASSLRQVIHQIDSTQIIEAVHTMDQVLDSSVSSRRAPLTLFSGFGAMALFLAGIGIYGVLSFYVLQRREEIGTRMALGAQRSDILRLVLGHAAKLIVAGIIAGAVVSLLVARTLEGLLYSVRPNDAETLLSVCVVLSGVALLACAVPLFRATHVDPQIVLRNE